MTAFAAGGKPASGLAFSPTSWNAGAVTVGQTTSQEFTLTFTGSGNTGPLTVQVAPADVGYSIPSATDNCSGVTLSAKSRTCTVTVEFAPTSAGSKASWLSAWGRKLSTGTLNLTGSATGLTCSGLSEGFDDVASLFSTGDWFQQNNSDGATADPWYQGFHFPGGPSSGYIETYYDIGEVGGAVSAWLLTPPLVLAPGASFTFYTISLNWSDPPYADQLQVRLSTNGTSTDVGSTPTDVGDFTDLKLTINPDYTVPPDPDAYPGTWTQYTVNITSADVTTATEGRIAFRYVLPNNTDYGYFVGVDTFAYQCPVS